LKLNVNTVLEKLTIEVPLDKPNWEKEREFLLKRPVFLKSTNEKDNQSKEEQDNNFRKN
jgi:hypothetical protein